MANLLYLVHRLPYPPNKGDKLRSYHLLRHLAREHRVFLGTFIDDRDDEAHVGALEAICAGLHVARLEPWSARVRSLAALATGEPLTLRYYRDAGLARWVERTVRRERIDAALVFSSSMAPYADALRGKPMLVDFVDVDSEKWRQYAALRSGPAAWLYRREADRLLAFERAVAARAEQSYFVTENEAALFRGLAPESRSRIEPLGNGVDAEHYAPDPARRSPFAAASDGALPIVFTGAMDYAPNVDAVVWFAREVLGPLRERLPAVRFHVVGRNPRPAVRALVSEAVTVTGTVPDVRPYLQHAAVVVAPLRIARGLQNKILEAMAMGRPVVASAACAAAIDAESGRELCIAANAAEFVQRITALLADPARAAAIGTAGRRAVLDRYTWEAHLAPINPRLAALTSSADLGVPA